jgi:hippurate hydrolase
MQDVAVLVARAHGCEATLRYRRLFPATVNSKAEAELCQRVLFDLLGEDKVDTDPQPLMASEDFAFMLEAKPGCYVWAGNGDGDGGCAVHNPHYDFNDELIPIGAAYWVRLVEAALPC